MSYTVFVAYMHVQYNLVQKWVVFFVETLKK